MVFPERGRVGTSECWVFDSQRRSDVIATSLDPAETIIETGSRKSARNEKFFAQDLAGRHGVQPSCRAPVSERRAGLRRALDRINATQFGNAGVSTSC
jgi:hypothetical protein